MFPRRLLYSYYINLLSQGLYALVEEKSKLHCPIHISLISNAQLQITDTNLPGYLSHSISYIHAYMTNTIAAAYFKFGHLGLHASSCLKWACLTNYCEIYFDEELSKEKVTFHLSRNRHNYNRNELCFK